ncbi:MAG: pyruvate kinase [Ignavibacteriales bacterium CG_4_9_14_3_um_filter_30_11]|nr:MAG: pyruvate kinase [Ignavibacteriales bacterium CG_4_9_14_3_um_filter_30_11]
MSISNLVFAKTKILCTLGPATESTEKIIELIKAGCDGIRLNFSHANQDYFNSIFTNIHKACVSENIPLAVLADLQGPKIRIGELSAPEIELEKGNYISIVSGDILGTKEKISTSYKHLIYDAKINDIILIDDGLLRLKITEKNNTSLTCLIENGGKLKPKKGINLPGMKLSTPSITQKDYDNLQFIIQNRVNYIALSFVREAKDIIELKDWLKEKNKEIQVIAKIEKKEACDNFDSILDAADGIMIARGDLGVELPPQEVPLIQKEIIKKCNAKGKLVITATQMLESMIQNPIPTRAEASDVANAVLDGTSVVMLSGETSVGKYPIETVKMMNSIITNTETHFKPLGDEEYEMPTSTEEKVFDSVGRSIVSLSRNINADAIVVFTFKGRTAINLSKYSPNARIIALSNSFETMNNLSMRWGVIPYFSECIDKEHLAINEAIKSLLKAGLIKQGELVIFTAGAPYSEKSRASWLRFEVI